jgi:hypothetical protein
MIRYLDPTKDHPGKQIQDWIDDGVNVMAVRPGGKYMDIGTLRGLKQGDNDIDDMIGYLILLKIAKKLAISVN